VSAVARADAVGLTSATPVQRARPLLGTVVAIRVDAASRETDAAIDAAFAEIERVHRAMSFHDADSELSRLNREAARTVQPVGTRLWRVLRVALALARASDGRFDPSVAARLVRSGHLPVPAHAPQPDPRATWRDVELLPQRQVRFHRALWLDLGGIAKGYAVDRAVAMLRAHGAQAGVVNAGGDLRVFGATEDTVLVRDPRDPCQSRPLLRLRDGAVATSAGYFSANAQGTALIDPHADVRLGADVSVSVCAPRAIWADALTKVVLADPAAAAPLLRRLHAQAALLDRCGVRRTLA
jgi:thiamine biosynthesis lipoprotein